MIIYIILQRQPLLKVNFNNKKRKKKKKKKKRHPYFFVNELKFLGRINMQSLPRPKLRKMGDDIEIVQRAFNCRYLESKILLNVRFYPLHPSFSG